MQALGEKPEPGNKRLPARLHRCTLFVAALVCMLINPAPARAQDCKLADGHSRAYSSLPASPSASHGFWDRKNILLFSGVAASRALDYASTRNMLARGREEILLPDDVVHSTAGFPALEVAGAATSLAISYALHRTGHHTLERWLSIGHIGVTTFGAVRNYSLESRHR
jgi:hypothetical protein